MKRTTLPVTVLPAAMVMALMTGATSAPVPAFARDDEESSIERGGYGHEGGAP